MKHTKLFVVLDEENLTIMKDEDGNPAKFKSEEFADRAACGKLNMWVSVEVNFVHRFLHHTV